jgi:hypothetical protein
MSRRYVVLLLLVLVLVAGVWIAWASSPPAHAWESPTDTPARGLELQGVASCASMACHHANGPKGSWRSEYTTWATYDPHSRAYTVLFDKRSLSIERTLRGLSVGTAPHPEEDQRCLSCHVSPRLETTPRHQRFSLADGVGCEACHGAAEKWLSAHYTFGPSGPDAARKARLGMTDTKNLRVRAEVCVTCHVGSGESDVNHDLIAAGHPRLRFELGAYLANYPKHYSEAKDKAGRPDFEARVWWIGQVVSLRAAVDLLEFRASKAEKPWPELSEYGCFACHHDLQSPSAWQENWLRQGGMEKRPISSLAWGTWYAANLPIVADGQAGLEKEITDLEESMSPRVPDRKDVATHCRRVSRLLNEWLNRGAEQARTERELSELLGRLVKERAIADRSWDAAAQVYLGLAAVYHGLGDVQPRFRQDCPLKESIKGFGRDLDKAFPRDAGARYESPRDFDPARVHQQLDVIKEQLKQLGIQ